MEPTETLKVRVRTVTWQAEGILSYELVPLDEKPLPAFEAGAHIDLHLGNDMVRSYSLLNAQGERERYVIGVQKDAASRGGSRWVHEHLHAGDVLKIGSPRNNFRLAEDAPLSVLIAGGIGITPLLGMARRLAALGKPWRLHYAARTRAHAAFLPELKALAEQGGGSVEFCFDQEPGGRMLDLRALVAGVPAEAHLYCCGPSGMLQAYERACEGRPAGHVHLEHFAGTQAAATETGYTVTLARSGESLVVPPGQTLLDSLIAIGKEPPFSCREGVCGTCEVKVLQGQPDHRDLVLSDAEKAANDRMMVCCSGAKSATLVLDL